MSPDGAVDYDGAAALAAYLVDDMRNEGLVVNGTTGEAPTTTDEEKARLIAVVREAVGDRASVIAGVGTNVTAHSVELAKEAEKAGADGLLVVTPYYNKPAQGALVAHFTAIADVTGLPSIIYDIPSRTGTAVATETLLRLGEHPRIVGVKDAKGDLAASSAVIAGSDLAYYSGDDPMNLPLWSVGGVGCISVTGHVVGDRIAEMLAAFTAGRNAEAARLHRSMLPVNVGLFRNQAAVLTKAAMEALGLPGGAVRLPLLPASDAERKQLLDDLRNGGVELNSSHAAPNRGGPTGRELQDEDGSQQHAVAGSGDGAAR
jgi:4-hydroxy-tetrahydrodipicolinate synthase